MKRSFQGQVSLEYMAIIGMVIIGIIAGGPYIVRSMNSYFHRTEDGLEDSLRERIGESAIYEMPGCSCEVATPGNCGLAECTVANADATVCCLRQRITNYSECTPPSCQFTEHTCQYDTDCCEQYAEACGAAALIPGTSTCTNCVTETSGMLSCADGLRMYRYECGDISNGTNRRYYDCQADPSCIFQCSGAKDSVATWCLGGGDHATRLPYTMVTLHVDSAAACSTYPRVPAQKCLAYCPPGWRADSTGGGCILCAPGQVWAPDYCPAGYCEQDICTGTNCADNLRP